MIFSRVQENSYHQQTLKSRRLILGLFLSILAIIVIAINIGAAETSVKDIVRTLLLKGDNYSNVIIWKIRLPRIIGSIIAGGGLAVAGCVMQTCLRNPIASPATLGISNAAAFGANLAIVFFSAGSYKSAASDAVFIQNPYIVTLFAFTFSIVAMLSILTLARLKGFTPEAVVLSGVAFGSLFSAGSTLIQYFADDVQVAAMVFWTFGDLGRVSWRELGIVSIVILIGSLYFLFNRWNYNALDGGESTAKSLGVNVERVRLISMLMASLITAISVAFMGIIGFVGLIAPQMMRRIIGEDHRFLIPASALMGSLVLIIADTLARTLLSPIVLPVGAITSFFGAPLFLYLLMRGAKRA